MEYSQDPDITDVLSVGSNRSASKEFSHTKEKFRVDSSVQFFFGLSDLHDNGKSMAGEFQPPRQPPSNSYNDPRKDSTSAAMAENPQSRASFFTNRHQQRVNDLRTQILTFRIHAISQREKCRQQRNYYRHARNEYMEHFGSEFSQQSTRLSFEHGKKELQRVEEELDQEDRRATAIDNQLSSLEYKLKEEEEPLINFLKQTYTATNNLEDLQREPREATGSSSISSSDNEHPLLRELHDKTSDIPILREHLMELEFEHGEERAARETRTTLGEAVSPPDLEFYSEYHQERDALLRELAETELEIQRLRSRCVEAKLLTKSSETSSRQTECGSEVLSGRRSRSQPPLLYQQLLTEDVKPTSVGQQVQGLPNARDRINAWLTDMPGEPGLDTPHCPTSEPVSQTASTKSE